LTTQKDADLSWLDNYDNISGLASFLVEVKGYNAKDLCYFIEKPYKFDDDYKEMRHYIENEIYPYGDNEPKY
tara:strand:- start:452 stop:667 length:216 start_codon:yes stop_codon:yes gene_type:complete